jgi:hypothetical protein
VLIFCNIRPQSVQSLPFNPQEMRAAFVFAAPIFNAIPRLAAVKTPFGPQFAIPIKRDEERLYVETG